MPEPPKPAERADDVVRNARKDQERKQRNLAGAKATKLTGPRGLMTPVSTGSTTLLGGQ